jgi:hypothetical protein
MYWVDIYTMWFNSIVLPLHGFCVCINLKFTVPTISRTVAKSTIFQPHCCVQVTFVWENFHSFPFLLVFGESSSADDTSLGLRWHGITGKARRTKQCSNHATVLGPALNVFGLLWVIGNCARHEWVMVLALLEHSQVAFSLLAEVKVQCSIENQRNTHSYCVCSCGSQ